MRQDGRVITASIRTPPHNLLLSRAPLEAIDLIVDGLHRETESLPGALGPPDVARAFAEAWMQRTGKAFRPGIPERIFQLERVTFPEGVPGRLRTATSDDRDLLLVWFTAFDVEAYRVEQDQEQAKRDLQAFIESSTRGIYLWQDREPVSMAGFTGPTPNGIRVGRVYTPPQFRRRGYASACVAALSQHLVDSGYRFCFLYTDLSNSTSNRIYQDVGYRQVADVGEYRFENQ